jgi:putative iron-only hydrogenase system regulator
VVGILVPDAAPGKDRVAGLLSEYGSIIIGKAELPCSERDMTLTCVTIKASTNDLGAFTGKLGLVLGVRVKSLLF